MGFTACVLEAIAPVVPFIFSVRLECDGMYTVLANCTSGKRRVGQAAGSAKSHGDRLRRGAALP